MALGDVVKALRDLAAHLSKGLVLSYIIDWILIIATAAVGYAFGRIEPNHNPFSLTDLNISFPYAVHETVTTSTLVLASLVAPAIIILGLTLIFIPGSTADSNTPLSVVWRRKLWEWNAGWMGLGVALAGVYLCTQGLKDLYGKPRPDMLDRCQPDLSNIAAYAVSGLGGKLEGAPIVVTWEICQNKSDMLRNSGFTSFPSGHSSFSWAGMTYLTLWLCSRFSIIFPYLTPYAPSNGLPRRVSQHSSGSSKGTEVHSVHTSPVPRPLYPPSRISIRNQGAAPPVYLLIIALVPLGVAAFISASRWFDHRHHGFDILFGSIMGILFAFLGFRLYNLPIRRGAGWSWGPRSRSQAFWKGIGLPNYVAIEGWGNSRAVKFRRGDSHQDPNGELGRRSRRDEPLFSSSSDAADRRMGSSLEEV